MTYWCIVYSMPGSMAIVLMPKTMKLSELPLFTITIKTNAKYLSATLFLKKNYWGGPSNFEIKKAMLSFAFKYVDRVNFHVGSKNIRSRNALEKIGAVKVDEFETKNSDGSSIVKVAYQIDQKSLLLRKAAACEQTLRLN